LAELRSLIDGFADGEVDTDELEELVTKFRALDGWLKKGGFLPMDWALSRQKDV
jgi:hypothetical protein